METLVKVEVFDHFLEQLSKFLDLLHDLLCNLVREFKLIFGVFIHRIVCFGQLLHVFIVNVLHILILFIMSVDAIDSKLSIMLCKDWLEDIQVREQWC